MSVDSPLYRNRRPPATAAAAAHRQLPGYDLGGSSSSGPVSRTSTPGKGRNTAALAEEGNVQDATSSGEGEYLALDMSNTGSSFTQMQLVDQQVRSAPSIYFPVLC